jgi:hypothetical protein
LTDQQHFLPVVRFVRVPKIAASSCPRKRFIPLVPVKDICRNVFQIAQDWFSRALTSTMASDDDYEYDYSDEEDYVLEEEDEAMEWNPMASTSDNPNAPPTISGT